MKNRILIGVVIFLMISLSGLVIAENTCQNQESNCYCILKDKEYSMCVFSNCSSTQTLCEEGCSAGECLALNNSCQNKEDKCYCIMKEKEYVLCAYSNCSSSQTPCDYGCSDGVCNSAPVNNTCEEECHCIMKEKEYISCTHKDCRVTQNVCNYGCDNSAKRCKTGENQEVTEKVTCYFDNSDKEHTCSFSSKYGRETGCSGIGNCSVDSFGFYGEKLNWKSDCGGTAETLLNGDAKQIYFDCDPTKCFDVGLRENSLYCSSDKKWTEQSDNKANCNNNFECVSNLCIDNQCVESGLFARFLRWLSHFFGGK